MDVPKEELISADRKELSFYEIACVLSAFREPLLIEIMRFLYDCERATHEDIAEHLDKRSWSVASMLQKLENAGLVLKTRTEGGHEYVLVDEDEMRWRLLCCKRAISCDVLDCEMREISDKWYYVLRLSD